MALSLAFESWQLPFMVFGAAFVALAVWLVVVDFRSPLNRSLALYLFLDGAPELVRPIDISTPDGFGLRAVGIVMNATAPFALVYFVLTFEERFGTRKWRRRALLPLIALAAAFAAVVARAAVSVHFSGAAPPGVIEVASSLQFLAPSLAALLFGYESVQAAPDRRPALQLASLAFALGPPFAALHLFVPGLMPDAPTSSVVAIAPLAVLAVYKARVAWTTRDAALAAGERRFLAVLALPVASVALLWLVSLASVEIAADVMVVLMGVWMLALPVLATYALVRHRLFGFEAKLRWGISKSTIAAVFIAVFFVASEAAQQFLGESLGSAYVGIAAAGALVFALAPLQRAAERLAAKAVPAMDETAPAAPPARASKQEEAYRRAVKLAWKDRALTPDEEVHLFHVAEALGVPAGRAMEIRHEVERDTRAQREVVP